MFIIYIISSTLSGLFPNFFVCLPRVSPTVIQIKPVPGFCLQSPKDFNLNNLRWNRRTSTQSDRRTL